MEHFKTYFNNLISNSPLITIPIVTCFGYLFAYQYEIGSAKYYYIPGYLVHIELLQVIFYAVAIYFIIFTLGLLFYLIVSNLHSLLAARLKPNQTNRTNRDIIVSWLLAALLVFGFLIVFPGILGEHIGGEKKSYIIFQKDNKDYAIVKIYGDSVIALALDERRALTRGILIVPKGQSINGTVRYFNDIKVGN